MKTLLFTPTLLAGALLGSPAFAADSCANLADLALPGVKITQASAQPAQTLPPDPMSAMTGGSPTPVAAGAHCLVEGSIGDRQGVGGRYATHFQLRLPQNWNGRFLFQGGGGTDGFIAPAIGAIPSTGSTATPALQRGYAVVSMDGGHAQMNLDFAADQQARLDLAYASIGKVTDTAKALLHSYYGKAPSESYFMGCSNGGREAMIAASRYPTEFDGVVAGNPGFHLSRAPIGAAWDMQALRAVAPEGNLRDALTQADLDRVKREVLKQCDALDGLEDGVVAAYGQCHFNPDALRGQLSDAKLKALKTIMQGAHDAQGNAVYSGWPWDPGMAAPGWRAWKLGSEKQPAMNETLSLPSLGALFMSPPQSVPHHPDFAALAQATAQVGGYFDADETYLSTFAQRGGRMLIFQGAADPIFSAQDISRWYREASRDTGGDFARLFIVPGMNHCGGGPAFEDFDPLTLLEQWRESGKAPASMPASAPSMPGRQMPLCAYPSYARYEGGERNAASSFRCVQP